MPPPPLASKTVRGIDASRKATTATRRERGVSMKTSFNGTDARNKTGNTRTTHDLKITSV
jgi:hypothetical protein